MRAVAIAQAGGIRPDLAPLVGGLSPAEAATHVHAAVWLLRGERALRTRDVDASLARLSAVDRAHPLGADARWLQGRLHEAAGAPVAAWTAWTEIADHPLLGPEARRALAESTLRAGDPITATAWVDGVPGTAGLRARAAILAADPAGAARALAGEQGPEVELLAVYLAARDCPDDLEERSEAWRARWDPARAALRTTVDRWRRGRLGVEGAYRAFVEEGASPGELPANHLASLFDDAELGSSRVRLAWADEDSAWARLQKASWQRVVGPHLDQTLARLRAHEEQRAGERVLVLMQDGARQLDELAGQMAEIVPDPTRADSPRSGLPPVDCEAAGRPGAR